jgi:hypothetical protein
MEVELNIYTAIFLWKGVQSKIFTSIYLDNSRDSLQFLLHVAQYSRFKLFILLDRSPYCHGFDSATS